MALLKTRFSRKLHVAFISLLLITLALAWYFYDSVKWYEYDVQRVSHASNILHAYQEVSSLTYRELNALSDRLAKLEVEDPVDSRLREQRLRGAIARVRQGIAAEVAFNGNIDQASGLEPLVGIDRVVEEIIRGSREVEMAIEENRIADAEAELDRLRSAGVAGLFNTLIQDEIFTRKAGVNLAESEAIALARYITRLLPYVMAVVAIFTLLMVFVFSRSLTRSVGTLHEGVQSFTSGNLVHRIPELREREFWRLGEAFNIMAKELLEHRNNLHDANIRLEAMVDERTSALQASNEKLADVDINRRKLMADISHEFRTPLTVIRGEAEIALRGKNNTKKDLRESFQRIIDQADHTTRLVDDLLFIARADAGEPRLKLRTLAISGMLAAVCKDFAAQAATRDNHIEFASEDDKAIVVGDSGRLRQVFAILIDNALRYSNRGGEVEVTISQGEQQVEIRVRDYGIGLSEEEAQQAFTRFYRGARAEEHTRGTGLGLPVAKAIVEAHQGSISLEGQPGAGATATVILPAESRLRVVA